MMKKVFPAMGWLLMFISGAAYAGLTDSLSGVWEGNGRQNSGSEWSIKITAKNGNYSIEYPSLSCGGKLLLISENSCGATFREELEYGLVPCQSSFVGCVLGTNNLGRCVGRTLHYPSKPS